MADPMSLGRGAMIVVEGLDRAGKSTQCINLVRNIEARGRKVRYMKFPGESTQWISDVPLPLLTRCYWNYRPDDPNWPDDKLLSHG